MRRLESPLVKGSRLREGQLLQLADFAEMVEKGLLVAINADAAERQLEGDYWLARLLGAALAFVCRSVQMISCMPLILLRLGLVSIVRIQWYKLMQVSQRAYVLLREERIVPVNTIVRLLGLSFIFQQ